MLLLLVATLKKIKRTDFEYFQEAYYWKYQKQANVYGDIIAWRVQKFIPEYVSEYTEYIVKNGDVNGN